jgi:DNA polymerase
MSEEKQRLLAMWPEVVACNSCAISQYARNKVFGDGNAKARIVAVGEAPGEGEDASGHPFIGRAGVTLTSCLSEAGIDRRTIFITNCVKCHPPKELTPPSGNRAPDPVEIQNCLPFLHRQIDIIRPRIIIVLGRVPLFGLFGVEARPFSPWFGRQIPYTTLSGEIIPSVITYHPQYLGYRQGDRDLRIKYVDLFRRIREWTESQPG